LLAKSISTGAQYVTPDSKIHCEKVKMCRFGSENWFFCSKFVQLAVAGKKAQHLCTSKKECNRLDLTPAQYFSLVNRMIGPGGLLLVVPTYMQL
jgi:hypothetical protein